MRDSTPPEPAAPAAQAEQPAQSPAVGADGRTIAPLFHQASALLQQAEAEERARVVPMVAPPPPPTDLARFEAWRGELARARSGGALLNALIDPADAPRLVPMLPVEDLHGFIRRIGLEDCTELLSLTSGAQVQGILDTEIWTKDALEIERLDPWLRALMAAGPEVLAQRLLAQDDELINWTVRRYARAMVVEDPDDFDPPDIEHVLTPDGRLCIFFPEDGERDLPVKIFLDVLMRQHPVFCVDLLIHSSAALDSVLQEQAYRWRSGRMADRGYVDYYEALAIYTPPQASAPVEASEGPAPRHWLVEVVDPDARLNAAIAALEQDERETLAQHLGYTANMALSADRVDLLDEEAARETMTRLRAGLVLGLDALAGSPAVPEQDARVLLLHGPSHVFRVGYARTLEAAKPLRLQAVRQLLRYADDPVGALDHPTWQSWGEALLDRHPRHPEGRPLQANELPFAQAWATALAHLVRFAGEARPAEIGLGAWLGTGVLRAALGDPGLAPLTADQVAPAHRALFDHGAIRPAARDRVTAWWRESGADDEAALALVLDAVRGQLGRLDPQTLDPRFTPWVRVEG